MYKYIVLFVATLAIVKPVKADDLAFLTADNLPNGVNYLPAPPGFLANNYCLDEQQYQWGKKQRNTARGDRAKADASVDPLYIAEIFSKPMGFKISPHSTPEIYVLMMKTGFTALHATGKAKKYYQRERPYIHYNEHTLVPEEEEHHRHSGSYPSGHASLGWAVALVLSEIYPQHQDELLKLGYEYGQSRVIAGYHYQSDVDAARLAASAAVARMHTKPEFLQRLQSAKKELYTVINQM